MYPTFADLINDLFPGLLPNFLNGILHVVNMFGLMLALSFLAAAWVLKKELHRFLTSGKIQPIVRKVIIGTPMKPIDLFINFAGGFIVGYKLGLFIIDFQQATANFQHLVFSTKGFWLSGILLGAGMAYWYYAEKKKTTLAEPEEKMVALTAGEMVSEIVVRAAIGGIIGAKIFHILEYWGDFTADPFGMFFSGSGLTFYGGLLLGAAAVIQWVIKHKLPFNRMADAVAPTLILAYAIGRIGCQTAGDGDWGIFNTAYITNENYKVEAATDSSLAHTLQIHEDYFIRNFGSVYAIPQAKFKGPDFLPNWLFAYNYPNNVGSEGISMKDCNGEHCGVLPLPVFPTPFYEIVMCLSIFLVLWLIRKKLPHAGMVMAIYMILNGMERFTIELIRVNSFYHFWGIQATQAEIIALVLIVSGAAYLVYLFKSKPALTD